jgi:hypothetical protein
MFRRMTASAERRDALRCEVGGRQAHSTRLLADRGGAVANDVNHGRKTTEEV